MGKIAKSFLVSMLIIHISCNGNFDSQKTFDNDSTSYDSVPVIDAIVEEEQNDYYTETKKEIYAIGKIKMGCSKHEFEIGKKAFLKEHRKLANIEIESFEGTFVEGKLARITIKSRPYKHLDIVMEHFEPGWEALYSCKYQREGDALTGYYKKGNLHVYVYDSDEIERLIAEGEDYKKLMIVRAIIRIDDPKVITDYLTEIRLKKKSKAQKEFDDI